MMQLNLKMLEDKVKKVEAEVVDLRELIRKAISQEVDLDELAASIVSHAVTEEDSTKILMKMRRQGDEIESEKERKELQQEAKELTHIFGAILQKTK